MDNMNSTVVKAIKEQISQMSESAFNDFLDLDKDIRELNLRLANRNKQKPTDADKESVQKDQAVQYDFYNDFDDLNDDDEF